MNCINASHKTKTTQNLVVLNGSTSSPRVVVVLSGIITTRGSLTFLSKLSWNLLELKRLSQLKNNNKKKLFENILLASSQGGDQVNTNLYINICIISWVITLILRAVIQLLVSHLFITRLKEYVYSTLSTNNVSILKS